NTARISNLIFASPFISLILLATIIGEAIHPTTLIGLIFIMLGLLVQQMKRKKALPTLNEG
ncbi:DMT family transporter, partial [Vibrio anguillarum]